MTSDRASSGSALQRWRPRRLRAGAAATLALVTVLALAGCDVRKVSWGNTTYTTNCLGPAAPVTLHNGTGVSAPVDLYGHAQPVQVYLRGLTVGALTGPHTVDEAVLLGCTANPTNISGTEVQVFASTPGNQPVRLVDRPRLPNLYPGGTFPPQVDRVLAVRVGTAELLQVSAYYWGPGDGHCCPSHHVTYTFHWNGSHFV